MKFKPTLLAAVFLKRYKRFLVDIRLNNGDIITIHCANTGSMSHCASPDSPCWYSLSNNPKRKLPGTLEITTTTLGHLAGVNTHLANKLVREAIENGVISELTGYQRLRAEVRYGDENSRIDFLLENDHSPRCYVEVKSVTLEASNGGMMFPDAVTTRGSKHLRELMAVVAQGHRGVLCFCIQHSAATSVSPASHIDPVYAQTLAEAIAAGVEVIAYACSLSPSAIAVSHAIDFRLNA